MNTKNIRFLAVLAVLAMAFAAVAVAIPAESGDAADTPAAMGLYTYSEDSGYTLVSQDKEIAINVDTTWFAYSPDVSTEVDLKQDVKVAAGVTLTITSYGSSVYTVKLAYDKKIDISTSAAILELVDVTLIIDEKKDTETGAGKAGIIGGGAAATAASGTVVLYDGASMFMGLEPGDSKKVTANILAYAGATIVQGLEIKEVPSTGGESRILVGSYSQDAAIKPAASSGYTEDDYVSYMWGTTGTEKRELWTIHMDAYLNDNRAQGGGMTSAKTHLYIPEGYTVTVINLNKTGGLDYATTVTNDGTIIVDGTTGTDGLGSFAFKASTTPADVFACGILGEGTVIVKDKATLIITEGKANEASGDSVSNMFAIGHNTIIVEKGGKMYALDNSEVAWGIVGDVASSSSEEVKGTASALPEKFIWALTGSSSTMTIEAKYTDPETSTGTTVTNGAVYAANGDVTIGVPNSVGYDWASRFDEISISNGTATLNGGLKMYSGNSGPTLTIEKGATVKLGKDVSGAAFATESGAVVNVKGTLDLSAMTLTSETVLGQIVVFSGGELDIKSTETEKVELKTVVNQGGKIYHIDGTTKTDMSSYYTGSQLVVSNETALIEALEEGVKNIILDTTKEVKLTQPVTVPSGYVLTIKGEKGLTVGTDAELVINGGTVSGRINTSDGAITIPETYPLTGTITFTKGSVSIDGSYTQSNGVITVEDNTVLKVSGTLNGSMTIQGDKDPTGVTVLFVDNFTVSATGTLILSTNDGITYKVGTYDSTTLTDAAYFYLYGTVKPLESGTSATTITVDKNGSSIVSAFTAYSGAMLSGRIEVSGSGSIDLSQAQNVHKIDEDISADRTYGQLEAVEIIGTLSIKNNSTVTVKGDLTINESVTLSIEAGSKLIINDGIATVTIDGKMLVEEGAEFRVIEAESVKIAGTLQSSGEVYISSTTTVSKNGAIDIRDDTTSSITVTKALTIAAGGKMTIRSTMAIKDVTNKGEITLSGAIIKDNSKISMASNGAILNIASVGAYGANVTLNVTDLGLVFQTSPKVVVTEDEQNVLSFTLAAGGDMVKGLTIKESVTSYTDDGETYYTNHMDLSGSVSSVDDDGATKAITITADGANMEVTDTLTLGAGVNLNNADSLAVSGTVYAIASDSVGSSSVSGDTGSMITVTGLIQTSKVIANATSIVSAAYFTEEVLGVTYHNYTTLVKAISSGSESVRTYGTVDVTEDLVIPSPVIVNNTGVINVGSASNTGVTVTVKDGAQIKGGEVDVYGILEFENKKNNKTSVVSDVSVVGDVSSKYTSVYIALAQAKAGETVTITREGTTTLSTSLTIPEGVTLEVPASKVLQLKPGVTLTVNGGLQTAELVTVDTTDYPNAKFAEKASLTSGQETAAISVNGIFKSMADVQYDYYCIPGAYYSFADSTGNFNYVSPVAIAVDTDAKTITVYGDVTAPIVEWAGTSTSAKVFNIDEDSSLTAIGLVFSYVNFNGDGEFEGVISYGDASVTASEVTGLTISNKDTNDVVMYVSSVTVPDTDDSVFAITSGSVTVKSISGDAVINDGAEMVVSNSGLTITGDLFVNGTLTVGNAKNAEIEGKTEVMGTINVAKASDDGTKAKGNLTMADVYLGMTEEEVYGLSASAVISGPITFDILYAAANSTVSEEVLSDTTLKYTAFYVEDALYLTAYTAGTYYISEVDYEIDTARFDGWFNEDEESAKTQNAKIGQTGWNYVYADLEYDVYTLIVKTDNGVKSVAVDGKELINYQTNVFVTYVSDDLGFKLAAGKYVLSFTLKDGYEGNPVLYDANGKAVVGGYGITIDGDYSKSITYQLSGTQKEVTPEPEPTPTPEKESEWNVTTILLLVLVILIAIMAVIVALRLNRN